MNISFFPNVHITGERSIRFAFSNCLGKETFNQVHQFCEMVQKEARIVIDDIVPSYHTVTVYLKRDIRKNDPLIPSLLDKWEHYSTVEATRKVRKLQIPVCYDFEFALDMDRVVAHTGLTEKEIISLHTRPVYTVYMIGFLPGFPYLGELNDQLTTPRLHTPRPKVAKGTVGIGGCQTGIYPIECPGGWNILGKTPLDIYHPGREDSFFIHTGDELQFCSIPVHDYYKIQKQLERYPESIHEFIVENDGNRRCHDENRFKC